jgi:hypothetical protein
MLQKPPDGEPIRSRDALEPNIEERRPGIRQIGIGLAWLGRGAGPVDPRTINRVSRRRCPGRGSRPSITDNSSRTAASPLPRTGWWTVVNGGSVDWASSMSSKPTRLMSPGTLAP